MKIGIFSDVHANIEALSAVLERLAAEEADALYCLGDVVGYGADPNACAALIQERAEATILGNHDAAVAGRMDYSYYYDAARRVLDAHRSLLEERHLAWLRGLPYQLKLDAHDMQLCHGSPVNLEEFEYIFAPEQARECLQLWDELPQLTLIGHSHLCKVFALDRDEVEELPAEDFVLQSGRKYIISVGSVGQPRDYDNRASFALFDTVSRRFSFRRAEYDIEVAAEKIFSVGIESNFGHRLFLGV